jgi:hypothetical protein
MVKASPWAVLSAKREGEKLALGLFALRPIQEELTVAAADREVYRERLTLSPTARFKKDIALPASGAYQVRLGTKLVFDSDPAARKLERTLPANDDRTSKRASKNAGRHELTVIAQGRAMSALCRAAGSARQAERPRGPGLTSTSTVAARRAPEALGWAARSLGSGHILYFQTHEG